MKNDSVPRGTNDSADGCSGNDSAEQRTSTKPEKTEPKSTSSKNEKNSAANTEKGKNGKSPHDEKNARNSSKKKKKKNLWPLWAMIISFFISIAVNVGSELALGDDIFWIAAGLVIIIMAVNVVFDMISMAVTTCDIEPFLSMASRKVRGARTAVKLAQKADVVSSICGDIVGDICGVVSGVCSATIATILIRNVETAYQFWIAVLVTAVISTATITCKAVFKKVAVDHANDIIFAVAKLLAFFKKDI